MRLTDCVIQNEELPLPMIQSVIQSGDSSLDIRATQINFDFNRRYIYIYIYVYIYISWFKVISVS